MLLSGEDIQIAFELLCSKSLVPHVLDLHLRLMSWLLITGGTFAEIKPAEVILRSTSVLSDGGQKITLFSALNERMWSPIDCLIVIRRCLICLEVIVSFFYKLSEWSRIIVSLSITSSVIGLEVVVFFSYKLSDWSRSSCFSLYYKLSDWSSSNCLFFLQALWLV